MQFHTVIDTFTNYGIFLKIELIHEKSVCYDLFFLTKDSRGSLKFDFFCISQSDFSIF